MHAVRRDQDRPDRRIVVAALGVTQILAWGSTFYLLGVLANPIASDTGWRYDWVISGVSVGLMTAGMVAPHVGRAIGEWGGRPILAFSAFLLADRKSTRLNSSHVKISYAVFCLKKKKK